MAYALFDGCHTHTHTNICTAFHLFWLLLVCCFRRQSDRTNCHLVASLQDVVFSTYTVSPEETWKWNCFSKPTDECRKPEQRQAGEPASVSVALQVHSEWASSHLLGSRRFGRCADGVKAAKEHSWYSFLLRPGLILSQGHTCWCVFLINSMNALMYTHTCLDDLSALLFLL